jgi:cytoplasmic FMR1 interacting protein
MERVDTLIADAIWEVLHAQVQEFVQNKLATMLRTTFKKKKDLARWGPLLSWNSTVVYFI